MKKFSEPFEETGTIHKQAPYKIALVSTNNYSVASASLGFQTIYYLLNHHPEVQCERFVADYKNSTHSLESNLAIDEFNAVAISISFENDIIKLLNFFNNNNIEPFATKRTDEQIYILGGAITLSNHLPFVPFFDYVFIGEVEEYINKLINILIDSSSKSIAVQSLNKLQYEQSAELNNSVQTTNESLIQPSFANPKFLPAHSVTTSPLSEFRNMFMIEISRGCPRSCKFCIINRHISQFRWIEPEIIKQIDVSQYKKIGLVGAAVSDHPKIKQLLEYFITLGKTVTLSSIRADRLDIDLMLLLKKAGYKTLTTAVDGTSERLRKLIHKGVREEHIIKSAELAHKVRMIGLRYYQIIDLPTETPTDWLEWRLLFDRVNKILPASSNISFLIPKKRCDIKPDIMLVYKKLKKRRRELLKLFAPIGKVKIDPASEVILHRFLSEGNVKSGIKIANIYKPDAPLSYYIKLISK